MISGLRFVLITVTFFYSVNILAKEQPYVEPSQREAIESLFDLSNRPAKYIKYAVISNFKVENFRSPSQFGFLDAENSNGEKIYSTTKAFVDEKGNILSINLSKLKIIDFSLLSKMPRLEQISISSSKLIKIDEIGNLKNLKRIRIRKFPGFDFNDISKVQSLEAINADFNKGIMLAGIGSLKGLKYFSCAGCALTTTSGISKLKSLVGLEFDGDKKIKFAGTSLPNSLQLLSIDNTADESLDFLTDLNGLRRLTLAYLPMSKLVALKNPKKLESLTIFNTHLSSIHDVGGFREMENLKKLNFGRNVQLKSIDGLPEFEKLEELSLVGIPIEQFTNIKLPNLKKLDLAETKIEKVGDLKGMPKLEEITVERRVYDDEESRLAIQRIRSR